MRIKVDIQDRAVRDALAELARRGASGACGEASRIGHTGPSLPDGPGRGLGGDPPYCVQLSNGKVVR